MNRGHEPITVAELGAALQDLHREALRICRSRKVCSGCERNHPELGGYPLYRLSCRYGVVREMHRRAKRRANVVRRWHERMDKANENRPKYGRYKWV